jgi:outer membrane immunogenic protein
MKRFAVFLGFLLSVLGAHYARSADLPLPGGPVPPSSYYPVSAPINWGGVYIGLNGGYGFGHSSWADTTASTGNFNVNGGLFGGTLGVNYAGFGDWVLLGFEGDFDWSGVKGSTNNCAVLGVGEITGSTCTTNFDWLATFRLRAGYTLSHFLFYATAGGAAGNPRLSDSNGNNINPTASLGWTAGGGIEYLFTDAISAKIEYLYVDLGKISCPPGALCSADSTTVSDGSVTFTESLIRVGVNYKFSW